MVPETEVEECFGRLLEVLNFLHTEFLRICVERGFQSEDLASALAGLAISAIDSLKASMLLTHYDDNQNANVMMRRFEEHFTLMLYFTLCDDGHMLARWFKNPEMILSEKNHKIRRAVDGKIATFFTRNPDWSFRDRFHEASRESVHPTWHSVVHAICWAAGRYGRVTPEARNADSLAQNLKEAQAVMLLGAIGPSVGRFIEFLEKVIFAGPEFAEVSPGTEYLAKLDDDLMRWWLTASQLLDELGSRGQQDAQSKPTEVCETGAADAKPADARSRANDDNGLIFQSEIHRLDWLIQQIEERVTKGHSISPPDPESAEVFVVTSSWMEICLTQAKAILALLSEELHAGAGPLYRALWELWIDWRYFLRVGDRRLNAAKVSLSAQLEALGYIETLPRAFEAAEIARLRASVHKFESEYPEASAQIREQRLKRRYHWSGLSHSAMGRELAPGPSLYKPFSWEAHAVMGPIRDVAINLGDGVASFQFGVREENTILSQRFLPFSSGGVLFYIYNEYADMWGLPRVVLPE